MPSGKFHTQPMQEATAKTQAPKEYTKPPPCWMYTKHT